MDKNRADVVVSTSGVSARLATLYLEVHERAVTLRATGGEVCPQIGGAGIGVAQIAGRFSAQSPVAQSWKTQSPRVLGMTAGGGKAGSSQTRSQITFTVFTGMDDVQVIKPRTGYRVPRDTG